MKRRLALWAALAIAAAGTSAVADSATKEAISPEERVNVVRMVNTIQAEHAMMHGKQFATLAEIKELLRKKGRPTRLKLPEKVEELEFEGFTFRMSLSDDRTQYNLALKPNKGCETAFFSDESGLIFKAMPLGCKEQASASGSQ